MSGLTPGEGWPGHSSLEGAGRVLTRGARTLGALAGGCAVVAVLIGVMVLAGYAFGLAPAVQVLSSLPPMYPITATSFIAGGVAVHCLRDERLRYRRIGLAAGAIVLLIGAACLVLHLTGAGPTVYDWWPSSAPVAATTPVPGRPVAETGVALSIIGMSLVASRLRRAPRLSQALAIGGVLVGISALVGYAIGVDRTSLGSSLLGVGMAVHTAVAISLVALGSVLARPTVGLVRIALDAGPAGRLGRRLLFVALVAPLLLAVLDSYLVEAFSDRQLAQSWAATLHVVALGLFVAIPVAALERFEAAMARAGELVERDVEASRDADLLGRALAEDMHRPVPAVAGWDIAFVHEPAAGYLAGDSIQLLVRDGRLLTVLIDVAGHDAVAGVLAARLRAQSDVLWRAGIDVGAMAGALNQTVADQRWLATMILCELDVGAGTVRYLNAGHPPGLLRHGSRIHELGRTGPALGLPASNHRVETAEMPVGALLVLYTDGLTEAEDRERAMLGGDALPEVIATFAHEGSEAVASALVDQARSFSAGRLRDDVLVAAFRRSR